MIFVLGVLGILQMSLIPGLLLYRILPDVAQRNFWLNLPLIFALSLIANYIGVYLLTSFSLYLPYVLRSIFIVELLGLLFLYPKFWCLPMVPAKALLPPSPNTTENLAAQYTRFGKQALVFLLILAVGIWMYSWGGVFGIRDPSVSYNIWAIAWAHNQFPILTWHYPQLMPANWSIPYVMMGSLPQQIFLEMFPAALNVVYPILFLLIFLDLFCLERNRAYAIAGFIVSLFLLSAWLYIDSGYADWPCAYLNLLALSLIYKQSRMQHQKVPLRTLLIIVFVIAATALIKPAGLYSALLLPCFLAFILPGNKGKRGYLVFFGTYLILLLLIAPWYIYAMTHETIAENHHADLVFLIWGIFRVNSWSNFFNEILHFGWIEIAFIAAIYVFRHSLPKFWRSIFYLYLPYFVTWMLFFSYDERNLALLVPILAINIGLIISSTHLDIDLAQGFKQLFPKINRMWILLLLLVLALGLSVNYNNYRENNLIMHEINAKNQIYSFHPGVVRMENYAICPGFQGKILDPMLIFATMPILAPHIINLPASAYGSDMLPQIFNDPVLLQQSLKNYPDVHYFIVDERFSRLIVSAKVQDLFNNWTKAGQLTKVFEIGGIALFQITVPLNTLKF